MDSNVPETTAAPAAGALIDTEEFAIVEIFGHRKHVGRIMEVERFGAQFLRVDVPNDDGTFGPGLVSHFYGGSSIFSLTLIDRATFEKMTVPRQRPGLLPMRSRGVEDDHSDFDLQ